MKVLVVVDIPLPKPDDLLIVRLGVAGTVAAEMKVVVVAKEFWLKAPLSTCAMSSEVK